MKRLGLLLTAVVLVLLVPGKQLFAQQAGSDKGSPGISGSYGYGQTDFGLAVVSDRRGR